MACNSLSYTPFNVLCYIFTYASYLTSSNLTHIDYQRIMFVWDKYGRFKLLFYKQKVCI